VSITSSRGNDDAGECQYETSRIRATLAVDPCACSETGAIPITVRYLATLEGKSFANAAGTVVERQRSTIGQRFFLREVGTTNDSNTLRHVDRGRPGDPDDTLDAELPLFQTLDCDGSSAAGRVLVTTGAFTQQIISWSASASRSGAAQMNIDMVEIPVRLPLPLRSVASPYPAFPGVPRDSRCSCHPVTGLHLGTGCPFVGGGGSVGGP
jgi:hypothetical protein